MRSFLLATLCVALGAGAVGCDGDSGSTGTAGGAEDRSIKVAYVNWADGVAITNLAAVVLEDRLDYEVKLTMADVAPIYTALDNGTQDVFLNGWLPITHNRYWEEFGDTLEDLGPNYEGAKIGLVVPDYAPVRSIEDLNANKDAFDGEIIGIDPGAGIMDKTKKALDAYNLDYKLVQSSGPAMTAALKKAIDGDEPIVVTGWTPHWMFARWDLRFLEDPQGVYGASEEIRTIGRPGFEADHPEAAAFLQNMLLNDEQLSSLMAAIRASDDKPRAVAAQWVSEHKALVDGWLGEADAADAGAAAAPNAGESTGH